MSVRLTFVGSGLFMAKRRGLDVLFPVGNGDGKATHPDGRPAKPHYPWLAIKRGRTLTPLMWLGGAKVVLEGTTGNPAASPHFRNLVDLKEITQSLRLRAPIDRMVDGGHAALRFDLRGGELDGEPTGNPSWRFNTTLRDHQRPPSDVTWRVTWDSGRKSLEVQVEGAGATTFLTVRAPDEIVAGNYDVPLPDAASLDPTPAPEELRDNDFKWIFGLLRPTKGTWASRLAAPTGNRLRELPFPDGTGASDPSGKPLVMYPLVGLCVSARF